MSTSCSIRQWGDSMNLEIEMKEMYVGHDFCKGNGRKKSSINLKKVLTEYCWKKSSNNIIFGSNVWAAFDGAEAARACNCYVHVATNLPERQPSPPCPKLEYIKNAIYFTYILSNLLNIKNDAKNLEKIYKQGKQYKGGEKVQAPVQDYTYESFNEKLRELSRYHLRPKQGKLGVNFFTVDAEDLNTVIHILEKIGFEVEQHGEILFLTYEYRYYEKKIKSVQYAYFHGSDPVLVVFALKSMDYYNSPLVRAAEKGKEIAHLQFFPKTFNSLIERTLSFPGAQIVEFRGIKITTSQSAGEKRPKIQKRKITYEAVDGEVALSEIKYKYGIIPTQVTFSVPGKVLFKVYENGRFILKEGDYNFFRRKIVYPALESALQPVRDFKKAKINLIDVGRRTLIERISVTFTISDPYDYDNFDDFLSMLRKAGFTPSNEIKRIGSVIYKSFLSDEEVGTDLSFYSNGQHFVLTPRFRRGFHSLLRFYKLRHRKSLHFHLQH